MERFFQDAISIHKVTRPDLMYKLAYHHVKSKKLNSKQNLSKVSLKMKDINKNGYHPH